MDYFIETSENIQNKSPNKQYNITQEGQPGNTCVGNIIEVPRENS